MVGRDCVKYKKTAITNSPGGGGGERPRRGEVKLDNNRVLFSLSLHHAHFKLQSVTDGVCKTLNCKGILTEYQRFLQIDHFQGCRRENESEAGYKFPFNQSNASNDSFQMIYSSYTKYVIYHCNKRNTVFSEINAPGA